MRVIMMLLINTMVIYYASYEPCYHSHTMFHGGEGGWGLYQHSLARASNGAGLHRHADALYRMGQKAILQRIESSRVHTLWGHEDNVYLHIVVCYDLLTFIYYGGQVGCV